MANEKTFMTKYGAVNVSTAASNVPTLNLNYDKTSNTTKAVVREDGSIDPSSVQDCAKNIQGNVADASAMNFKLKSDGSIDPVNSNLSAAPTVDIDDDPTNTYGLASKAYLKQKVKEHTEDPNAHNKLFNSIMKKFSDLYEEHGELRAFKISDDYGNVINANGKVILKGDTTKPRYLVMSQEKNPDIDSKFETVSNAIEEVKNNKQNKLKTESDSHVTIADDGTIKVDDMSYDDREVKEHINIIETKVKTIPTKVSQLTNDSGYLTEHQSLSGYYTKTEIDSKNSQLSEKIDDVDNKHASALENYRLIHSEVGYTTANKSNIKDFRYQVPERFSHKDIVRTITLTTSSNNTSYSYNDDVYILVYSVDVDGNIGSNLAVSKNRHALVEDDKEYIFEFDEFVIPEGYGIGIQFTTIKTLTPTELSTVRLRVDNNGNGAKYQDGNGNWRDNFIAPMKIVYIMNNVDEYTKGQLEGYLTKNNSTEQRIRTSNRIIFDDRGKKNTMIWDGRGEGYLELHGATNGIELWDGSYINVNNNGGIAVPSLENLKIGDYDNGDSITNHLDKRYGGGKEMFYCYGDVDTSKTANVAGWKSRTYGVVEPCRPFKNVTIFTAKNTSINKSVYLKIERGDKSFISSSSRILEKYGCYTFYFSKYIDVFETDTFKFTFIDDSGNLVNIPLQLGSLPFRTRPTVIGTLPSYLFYADGSSSASDLLPIYEVDYGENSFYELFVTEYETSLMGYTASTHYTPTCIKTYYSGNKHKLDEYFTLTFPKNSGEIEVRPKLTYLNYRALPSGNLTLNNNETLVLKADEVTSVSSSNQNISLAAMETTSNSHITVYVAPPNSKTEITRCEIWIDGRTYYPILLDINNALTDDDFQINKIGYLTKITCASFYIGDELVVTAESKFYKNQSI